MLDDYQIPASALIAALLLAFGYLHLRSKSVRTLLWLLGMSCVFIHSVLFWRVSNSTPRLVEWGFGGGLPPASAWMSVASESALMISSALFLASLSPLTFRLGRIRMLFVVPYIIPLLAYSILYYGISPTPDKTMLFVYCGLAVWAGSVGLAWSLQQGPIPVWLACLIVGVVVAVSVPFFLRGDVYWPLLIVQSGNMLMTALLVLYTFQRISPGVILTTLGLTIWAMPPLFGLGAGTSGMVDIYLARAMVLAKVVMAMGLLVLMLEDEIAKNESARVRERRVRMELEAYSRLLLTARNLEEFDRESEQLCAMISKNSRFSKVALVVRGAGGGYAMAGTSGMDGATSGALDALVQRLPPSCFSDGEELLAQGSTSLDLDLGPWLMPGDDLERLRMVRVGAVALRGQDNSVEGAVLLAGLRDPQERVRADDLLPVETLAGRLQAARSQAMMLGKLIESERFAGVGQLATNVAQQLHNPLTVVLGYAALLEDSLPQGMELRGAEAIVYEARRMKSILDRISVFSRHTTERYSSILIPDLIADVEQLHRADFLRLSIEFRQVVAPGLPNLFGNVHQIRQALMHVMQYAIDSAQAVGPEEEKAVRLEASLDQGRVRIVVAHTGPGFSNPERAFDALSGGFTGNEGTGVGLSLCAAIVKEHRGNISAVNLEPTGAAVILELPVS